MAKTETPPASAPAPAPAPDPAPAPAARRAVVPEDYVRRLEEENDRLRAKLTERGEDPGPARPRRPSFGLSEGERADLEQNGETSSPFTGEKLTAQDEGVQVRTRPDVDPKDPDRVASKR